MRELRVHETTMHPSAVLARISLAKNRMETPESFLESGSGGRDQLVGSVWQRYREFLARTRALDFDDLLLETVRLLREHEERGRSTTGSATATSSSTSTRTRTTRSTRSCARSAAEHRNVCVVGDDDQSIYGWRGADIRKILGFHRDFEGAKVVRLQTNYRSTRPILDAANAVIRHNASRHDKALESARGEGADVRFAQLKDETSEAQFVVGEMSKVTKPGRARPGDFAILCRTQVQFRPFEAELRAAGLPYVVVGGMSFFDRKEVRDVVAYLKLADQPARRDVAPAHHQHAPARGGQGEHRQGPGLRHPPRHPRGRGVRPGGGDRGALPAVRRGLPGARASARRARTSPGRAASSSAASRPSSTRSTTARRSPASTRSR